ncbi:hypothetical protein F8O01_02560 [Pseudoclavibacter chungangensis]|uniref:Uncharacterized protein n=1 Tax=Pseudoclavibacter chungangensis TaxID=587635 RepID=A0A7J5C012_9MICO|nr:hypothetical protein [Pseudoclavibacter chungangensis]KAB1660234.1 hypothetical protein F8O01_02560 [Pseudoclavibacter chungangensis]NYJ65574.1 hypothetical protein [Pseudoclavibacter chungangensis]
MAGYTDYFISGDHVAGKGAVAAALQQQGFRVESTPAGGLAIERGSLGTTLLLGGLAGKNFHVKFVVEFSVDEHGTLVARLHREMSRGALKGGAIGAAKTSNAFDDTARALDEQLRAHGLLLDVRTGN